MKNIPWEFGGGPERLILLGGHPPVSYQGFCACNQRCLGSGLCLRVAAEMCTLCVQVYTYVFSSLGILLKGSWSRIRNQDLFCSGTIETTELVKMLVQWSVLHLNNDIMSAGDIP